MKQGASGLDYLHEQNVVHRDLKTENMLLKATEDIKLAYFGLARPFIVLKTNERSLRLYDGSWLSSYIQYYMNSEVGNGHYTEKADVFFLWCHFLCNPVKGFCGSEWLTDFMVRFIDHCSAAT